MKKIKYLAVVWGLGILGFIMLYYLGGDVSVPNRRAGKIGVFIILGVLYGTYKIFLNNDSENPN